MQPEFYVSVRQVDSIVAEATSLARVDELVALSGRPGIEEYVFAHALPDSDRAVEWFERFREKGYFSPERNPRRERDPLSLRPGLGVAGVASRVRTAPDGGVVRGGVGSCAGEC